MITGTNRSSIPMPAKWLGDKRWSDGVSQITEDKLAERKARENEDLKRQSERDKKDALPSQDIKKLLAEKRTV
jgi:hypothetical protein